MAGTIDSFSYGKKSFFLCKIFSLFLPCNMAAVQNLYLLDKRLYWDMLKMEIRSFTICFCKQIAKNKKNEEAVLQQQFTSLHKLMYANPGQETVAKFYEVKLKLEQISMHKTEGAMIRSKARWCEQGERSTRTLFLQPRETKSFQ